MAGKTAKIHKNLRAYNLFKVSDEINRIGTFRAAEEKDLSYIPFWARDFREDTHMLNSIAIAEDYENAKWLIENKMIYVLECNGCPVSTACLSRETHKSLAVNRVYTPPFFRGRGYATSCVASLSQLILDRGYDFALLFTDLANPTSNSIYQKIGYRAVCDFKEIQFV